MSWRVLWLKSLDKEESKRSNIMKATIFLASFVVIAQCLFLVWMKVHHGDIWFVGRWS